MLPSPFRIAERGAGRWPGRQIGAVPPLWSSAPEPYPGALVLEDLSHCAGDTAAVTRVLARFAALRVAIVADAGVAGAALAREREAARPYIEALPSGAEAACLEALLGTSATAARIATLRAAASLAAPHTAGAFAFLRVAWAGALANRLEMIAAEIATEVAALARAAGALDHADAWDRRAAELRLRPDA